jgi:hypothetical protein
LFNQPNKDKSITITCRNNIASLLSSESWQGLGIFLLTIASRLALGPTQPPLQWVPGALSLVVKQPWHEADHLVLRSRMHGAVHPLLQHAFMAWFSVKKSIGTLPLIEEMKNNEKYKTRRAEKCIPLKQKYFVNVSFVTLCISMVL